MQIYLKQKLKLNILQLNGMEMYNIKAYDNFDNDINTYSYLDSTNSPKCLSL